MVLSAFATIVHHLTNCISRLLVCKPTFAVYIKTNYDKDGDEKRKQEIFPSLIIDSRWWDFKSSH